MTVISNLFIELYGVIAGEITGIPGSVPLINSIGFRVGLNGLEN
jgi:hypothetical protein